jgi:hypothetical protein
MNETKNFTLRTALLAPIIARVKRLNRRAERLGVDPIDVNVGSPRLQLIENPLTGVEKAVEVIDLTISLNVPKLADWAFVCTIQHTDAGNLLLTVPSAEKLDLSRFRSCGPSCDHCGKPRSRRDTYVVQHTDGTLKQVGKDCLCHFTGAGRSPEQAADYAAWLSQYLDALSATEEAERSAPDPGFSGRFAGVGLDNFLNHVVAVSRVLGFRTRVQAEWAQTSSTKDDALLNLDPPPSHRRRCIEVTDEDRNFARLARSWAQCQTGTSDFDHNMRTIASNDAVLYRNTGIAAYIVEAFRRSLAKAVEQAARPASFHFGEVKKRLRNLKLTYKGNASFDTDFGVMFIHRFVTEDGSDAVWKTSTALAVEPGATFPVDATVKAHDEYKGRPQTVLTRLVVRWHP